MTAGPRPRFQLLNLGPLPHERVSKLLNIPMPEGVVHCSAGAQFHAWRRHGVEFLACHAYMSQTVTAPTYIGRGPRQNDGFEMILEVANNGPRVLVAVLLRPSNAGVYQVTSCYPIDKNTISRRLRKRFLFVA